jgi:hypothetical protein
MKKLSVVINSQNIQAASAAYILCKTIYDRYIFYNHILLSVLLFYYNYIYLNHTLLSYLHVFREASLSQVPAMCLSVRPRLSHRNGVKC